MALTVKSRRDRSTSTASAYTTWGLREPSSYDSARCVVRSQTITSPAPGIRGSFFPEPQPPHGPLDDASRNRAAVAEAVAPIAARKRREPRPVLLPERTIEAEGAAKSLDVLGPDVRVREVDGERTAGRRVYQ